MFDELEQFLNDPSARNRWIVIGAYKMYVRKTHRVFFGDKLVYCFDLANIQCELPGSGQFPRVLDEIEIYCNVHDIPVLHVESVLTNRFCEFFRRRGGWNEVTNRGIVPSFYKVLDRRVLNG